VLVHAVVVAGDGARSHVHARSNLGVAQVGEVVAFDPLPSLIFLVSTKFPTWAPSPMSLAGAQVRIGTNDRAPGYASLVQDGTGTERHAVADFRVADDAVGADAAVTADASLAEQLDEGLNHGVGATSTSASMTQSVEEDARPGGHQLLAFGHAQEAVDLHHFGAGIAAQHLGWVGGLHRNHFGLGFAKQAGHVGQVVLAMGVVGLEFADPAEKRLDAKE